MTDETTDRAMMARALVLAERGRDTVRPNPMVGCVLVREGRIVGEGFHVRAGTPHAEVVALQAAGDDARGATAYVSLEPCDHTGRTGPCSEALLSAGVARVVYALPDPDPVAQGGHRRLQDGGVAVEGGLLEDWARTQNEVFVHTRATGRPFLTLKIAQTLGGEMHVRGRRWITGEVARTAVHQRRAGSDAVLVGAGTVLADDPELTVRHVPAPGGQPRPVVLDGRGRTPLGSRIVREGAIVVTTDDAPPTWVASLESAGVDVVTVDRGTDGGVDLHAALGALHARDVQALFAEPGPTLTRALVAAGLVDRLVAHVAVSLIGPHGVPRLTPHAEPPAEAGWQWRTERTGYLGADLEVVCVPQPTTEAVPVAVSAPQPMQEA